MGTLKTNFIIYSVVDTEAKQRLSHIADGNAKRHSLGKGQVRSIYSIQKGTYPLSRNHTSGNLSYSMLQKRMHSVSHCSSVCNNIMLETPR